MPEGTFRVNLVALEIEAEYMENDEPMGRHVTQRIPVFRPHFDKTVQQLLDEILVKEDDNA